MARAVAQQINFAIIMMCGLQNGSPRNIAKSFILSFQFVSGICFSTLNLVSTIRAELYRSINFTTDPVLYLNNVAIEGLEKTVQLATDRWKKLEKVLETHIDWTYIGTTYLPHCTHTHKLF